MAKKPDPSNKAVQPPADPAVVDGVDSQASTETTSEESAAQDADLAPVATPSTEVKKTEEEEGILEYRVNWALSGFKGNHEPGDVVEATAEEAASLVADGVLTLIEGEG